MTEYLFFMGLWAFLILMEWCDKKNGRDRWS